MKLNEDWDQVYRSATLGLQHRVEALELENSAIKQLNNRLLLKAEQQQVNTRTITSTLQWPIHCNESAWQYGSWGNSLLQTAIDVVYMCDVYCCILNYRVQRSITSRR